MKRTLLPALAVLAVAGVAQAQPVMNEAFTYQGQLEDVSGPITGTVDIRADLYDAVSGGFEVGSHLEFIDVPVVDGVFTLDLDFGIEALTDDDLWIEILVRNPSGSGTYETLTPRQRLAATPYALQTRGMFVDSGGSVGIATEDTTDKRVTVRAEPTGGWMQFKANDGENLWHIGELSNEGGFNLAETGIADRRMLVHPGGNVEFGGNLAVGGGPFENPFSASRFLTINGKTDGSFAGTASLVLANPVREETWTIATNTSGNLNLIKDGGGGTTVSMPVLRITGGSDIAEPFDVNGEIEAIPGMVVSIDPQSPGDMLVSRSAYDTRVAGIISGAGGVNVGMTLSQDGTIADGELPVALSGRVYCYVDADANGPVSPGDLLTSSATPGHAMRASDESRRGGAVIGKAMSSLEDGQGLVLVLVNLQ